tara:strand:- start:1000 stop:1437 length:438 start_codon:yes stop_codon:yes gene_type:complete
MEYFIILTLGIFTRIILGFVNYTKSLGLELSNEKDGAGYQNAITPPLFPVIASIIYGLSLFFIISGFFEVAFINGFIYLGLYLLTLIVIGATLFKPNSLSPLAKPFYHIVLNSMVNRYANYKKNGDEVRAKAIGVVIEKFKKAYK